MIEAVRGYRWWRVSPSGFLRSPWYGKAAWHPKSNDATCLARPPSLWPRGWLRKHPSGPPAAACGCGLYGLRRVPRGLGAAFPWEWDAAAAGDPDLVFGVAEGWGRVVLGSNGWRAERARAAVLYVRPGHALLSGLLPLLRRRYVLPIVPSLDELVGEWGPDPAVWEGQGRLAARGV